jgi:hypothetical protein
MCLTTVQQSYHAFKTYDHTFDFEDDLMNLDLLEVSSLESEYERSFSNASDFSDIIYGNLPSEIEIFDATIFEMEDERSFSDLSDFSDNTFETLISDTSVDTLVDTLIYEPDDSLIESSDSIPDDHVSSMIAFLATSHQRDPIFHSFPITEKRSDETNPEELKPSTLVRNDEVQRMDVLSGRGGKSNHHFGNKVFRNLVTAMKSDYQSSKSRTEKARVAESIVEKIYRMGGQFLCQNKACLEPQWCVMSKAEARRKTSQALRETRTLQWIY